MEDGGARRVGVHGVWDVPCGVTESSLVVVVVHGETGTTSKIGVCSLVPHRATKDMTASRLSDPQSRICFVNSSARFNAPFCLDKTSSLPAYM